MSTLSKEDVRQAIHTLPVSERQARADLRSVLPILEEVWKKAPWYVKLFFDLVKVIREYLDSGYDPVDY